MERNDQYFILSSACKHVKGSTRSLVIDYGRGNVYFFSNDYYYLIEALDRRKISDIERTIDLESRLYFADFIDKMLEFELGFLTDTPEAFPKMEKDWTEPYLIQDAIVEVDENVFDKHRFKRICQELDELNCNDLQIRLLSEFNMNTLSQCLDIISETGLNYVEVHCAEFHQLDLLPLYALLEKYAILTHLFIYGAAQADIIDHLRETPDRFPVSLGNIYFLNYEFNSGQCCGIINYDNLSFTKVSAHHKLMHRNGCLDKKVSIDRYGNIKNCPSMINTYGHIDRVSIREILFDTEFLKYGGINKDQISVCKDCEFRYNCTDCRAYLSDPLDLYSKPAKCGYNPYTGNWEKGASALFTAGSSQVPVITC
jgi:SPASM domain peptide maturase of grasp-with-spasm system